MTLTSRKTEREVRLRLDRLDEVLLRKILREELEAHEARKNPPKYVGYPTPGYWDAYTNNRTNVCGCGRQNYCRTPLTCGLWPNV